MANRGVQQEGKLFSKLVKAAEQFALESDQIAPDRKRTLMELATFVSGKVHAGEVARLIFICTHNSRRSHMAQLWAQAAACYNRIEGVACFSGGTEATAFNPRAVAAMQEAGFSIRQLSQGNNPLYEAKFSDDAPPLRVFSKKYSDPLNPASDFGAVMTCSHADANCPLVAGASERISLPYDDPKNSDGLPNEESVYRERARQIGCEIFFAFSKVT